MSASKPSFPYIIRCFDEDIEQHSESLREFSPAIRQLTRGDGFRGRSTQISLRDVTLIRRVAAPGYSTSCWVPHQANFLFPLSRCEIFARGRLLGVDRQMGSLGNHESQVIFPQNCEHLLVTIPLQSLMRYLDSTECGLFLETLAIIENCTVDARLKRDTTLRLLDVFQRVERSTTPLSAAVMAEYCQLVVNILFEFLAYHRHPDMCRPSNQEKILQRAVRLIEANPTRLLTLEELAREVFASKRAVQYAFSSITGLSPMRFQKMLKLNLVRSELKGAPGSARFAAIAAKYSFSNAGRLGREYRELFGESPRQTLRQAPDDGN